MNRSVTVLVAAILVGTSLASSPTDAQWARRTLPSGSADGLEMSIDGARMVHPGGTLTYLLALHEIRGDDFRPVADAEIVALASFAPRAPVATVNTDERGRATVTFEVPADLPTGFRLELGARTPAMHRRFEIFIRRDANPVVHLTPLAQEVVRGDPIPVFGTVRAADGQPLRTDVALTVGPDSTPVVVRTDVHGVFTVTLPAPERVGFAELAATVRPEGAEISTVARGRVHIVHGAREGMQIHVTPESRTVPVGGSTTLHVRVRDARGRPIRGARIVIPTPRARDEVTAHVRTGPDGVATVRWDARDEHRITVHSPGYSSKSAPVGVTIDEGRAHLAARVEGGVLLPALPSYVYMHAVDVLGHAHSGQRVRITGSRFDDAEATTDDSGIARVEVRVRPDDETDRCGGASAIAATLHIGSRRRMVCLPMDPDGTVRVRAERADGALDVQLERRTALGRAPTLVTAFVHDRDGLSAVYQQVVDGAETTLRIPHVPQGELLVRARPLIGPGLAEVRGGSALVGALATAPQVRLAPGTRAFGEPVDGHVEGGAGVAFVAPASLARALRARYGVPSALAIASELSARTPLDIGAAAVLREGEILATPLPEDAAAHGVLRDPWRQRARYRSGRLALVLRALEAHVAASPLEDVAHPRRGGGYAFNRAILDAIPPHEMGAEGARDLGGLPLTLDALRAMDPALTFDRVAQRITRRRLLSALVALRRFVIDNELDLPFARVGEPEDWWPALGIDDRETLDGWGRPMRFMRARSGRARFTMLEPVAGVELVSAGPDGRFGTRDDMWDPSARVLPSGSLYAEAMNEDRVLAQIGGVALGRATIEALYSIEQQQTTASAGAGGEGQAGFPLPAPTDVPLPFFREAARPSGLMPIGEEPFAPAEPRRAAQGELVVLAWNAQATALESRPIQSTTLAQIAGALPRRLTPGEPIVSRIALVGAGAGVGHIEARAEGARVRLLGDAEVQLREGSFDERSFEITLEQDRGAIEIRLMGEDGAVITSMSRDVRAAEVDPLRARTAEAAIDSAWDVRFDLPEGVDRADVRLTAIAPGAIDLDPALSDARAQTPAMLAWAAVLSGRLPSAELMATMRARPARTSLEAACEAIVLAASEDEADTEHWRTVNVQRLQAPLDEATAAETLAALAHVAPTLGEAALTPSERVAEAARNALWTRARQFDRPPGAMARIAAALLLADPGDSAGRALYTRALERTVERDGGRAIARDPSGTMALAVAAEQLGEHASARELARGGARRSYVAAHRGGSALFWLLAASAHGAFGRGAPEVSVDVPGQAAPVTREGGLATASWGVTGDVRARIAPPQNTRALTLVRIEATYARPEEARTDSPLRVAIEGDAGRAGDVAGLELHVRAIDDVDTPTLGIQLPAATTLSTRALVALEGVQHAEVDSSGLVTLTLAPMTEGERRVLALPARWLGSGSRRGFSVGAWNENRPWQISATPARRFDISP